MKDIWGPQLIMANVAGFFFSSPNTDNPTHWFGRVVSNPSYQEEIKVINFSQVCMQCYKKNPKLIQCEHIKIKKSRLKDNNTGIFMFYRRCIG